ncbi:DUF4019 domain-containing protein [Cellvibrio sp. ARAG 10.3]|uniref:DUF4019 domain-containing protein n=1 Tax=Cellvibrio sp. ARAG 10.3 TaxID=3451358 RepID=UPI003F44D44B
MNESFEIVRILGLGTIGLGFLLAVMAFRLLNAEQNLDNPRENILSATNRFMIFSFSLCILGISSELFRAYHTPAPQPQQGLFAFLSPGEQQGAKKSAETFLENIDSRNFDAAYSESSKKFQQSLSLSEFSMQAESTLNFTGELKARRFHMAQKGTGTTPDGLSTFYYITFASSYEKIINAIDTVTMIKDDNDDFKVIGYYKN